jgi:DNA-directed RNA polymerase subunit K/omega
VCKSRDFTPGWSKTAEEGHMTYIPRNKVVDLIPNKFKAIKIAALEARRLNERARMFEVTLPGKITTLAVERLIDGKVEWFDTKERARLVRAEREQEEE